MEPLATLDRLAARVGEPIVSDAEIALANEVLAEASALVRHYGLPWPDPTTAPAVAVSIAVAAAARGYLNPAGYQSERGDTAMFQRIEEYASGCSLSTAEIAALKEYNPRHGVLSVGVYNNDRPRPKHRDYWPRGYAPFDESGEKPFPLGENPPYDAMEYPWWLFPGPFPWP